MIINKKCDCGNKSTGNTTIRCCNLCGLPIPTGPWHFNLAEDIFNWAGAMPKIVDIDQLCELCNEYKHNKTKIYLAESEMNNAKKYEHLNWVAKRETENLEKLNDRQNELKELIRKQFSA